MVKVTSRVHLVLHVSFEWLHWEHQGMSSLHIMKVRLNISTKSVVWYQTHAFDLILFHLFVIEYIYIL